MNDEPSPPAAGEPEINISSLNPRPFGGPRERPWLPNSFRQAMQAGLAITAIGIGIADWIFGAIGAAIGNQDMVRYAWSSLPWLAALWAVVYLACFVGPVDTARLVAAAASTAWSWVRGQG
jgi:hypothetical protein